MVRKVYVIPVIVSLIACNLMLYYSLVSQANKSKVVQASLVTIDENVNSLNQMNDVLRTNFAIGLGFNGRKIQNAIVERFSDTVHSSWPKLIFRFSFQNCEACVEENLEKLKELALCIDKQDIVLLGDFISDRDLHTFRLINEVPFAILNVKNIHPGLDTLNYPFYCVLESDLTTNSLFLPIYRKLDHTDKYFSFLQASVLNVNRHALVLK